MGREPKPKPRKSGVRSDPQSQDSEATRAVLTKIDDLVPKENQDKVAVIIEETISKISHYSGPLPHPSDLAAYDAIQTGLAERLVRMAEKEQDGRLNSVKEVITKDYALKSRGQHYALFSVIALGGFASFLAYLGDTTSAAWVAVAGITSVVGIFVTGKFVSSRESKKELEDEIQD